MAALDRIDLDVRPGELVCVVGASGCGKCTLLNLIADLDRPTAGQLDRVTVGTALMFQDAALFPWLTVAGNVDLALKLRRIPRADPQAAGARRCCARCTWSGFGADRPMSCRAACASGWRWPGRSPRTPTCC